MPVRTGAPLVVRALDPNLPRIDIPRAGFYRVKLVKNGPWVSARLWYGPPNDPVTGEPLDRSPRWQALRNGHECELADLWPWCAGQPIEEAEYEYLLQVHCWAVEHDQAAPEANPHKAIDMNVIAPIKFSKGDANA